MGALQLPLSLSAAADLKQRCSQAPFGMGEATVVDTSVRNTLQLAPTEFSVAGTPSWLHALAHIIERAAVGLGLGGVQVRMLCLQGLGDSGESVVDWQWQSSVCGCTHDCSRHAPIQLAAQAMAVPPP
jgi:hypothetical protein